MGEFPRPFCCCSRLFSLFYCKILGNVAIFPLFLLLPWESRFRPSLPPPAVDFSPPFSPCPASLTKVVQLTYLFVSGCSAEEIPSPVPSSFPHFQTLFFLQRPGCRPTQFQQTVTWYAKETIFPEFGGAFIRHAGVYTVLSGHCSVA